MGFNTDEMVIVPVASAEALFNTESLFRILVEAKTREQIGYAKDDAEEILQVRHEGERDVTVITQDAVLATFDRILRALTLAVGGIAAISLAVAGILIMNVMLIAVTQRRREIGLLKALGASGAQIRAIFFTEAVLLALGGAAVGLRRRQGRPVADRRALPEHSLHRAVVGGHRRARSPPSSPPCCSPWRRRGRRRSSIRCWRCPDDSQCMRTADFIRFAYLRSPPTGCAPSSPRWASPSASPR